MLNILLYIKMKCLGNKALKSSGVYTDRSDYRV